MFTKSKIYKVILRDGSKIKEFKVISFIIMKWYDH